MNENLIDWVRCGVVLAGVGQLILVFASAVIPRCLGWKKSLVHIPLILRQQFWAYAGYILGMHLFFGLFSVFGTDLLLDGSAQAALFCGMIMIWWMVRVGLQFLYFDRAGIPATKFNLIAEMLLVALFVFLSIVYAAALFVNLR